MPRIPPPYLQYRHRVADHVNWQNKGHPSQQQQDTQVQRLAARPVGLIAAALTGSVLDRR